MANSKAKFLLLTYTVVSCFSMANVVLNIWSIAKTPYEAPPKHPTTGSLQMFFYSALELQFAVLGGFVLIGLANLANRFRKLRYGVSIAVACFFDEPVLASICGSAMTKIVEAAMAAEDPRLTFLLESCITIVVCIIFAFKSPLGAKVCGVAVLMISLTSMYDMSIKRQWMKVFSMGIKALLCSLYLTFRPSRSLHDIVYEVDPRLPISAVPAVNRQVDQPVTTVAPDSPVDATGHAGVPHAAPWPTRPSLLSGSSPPLLRSRSYKSRYADLSGDGIFDNLDRV